MVLGAMGSNVPVCYYCNKPGLLKKNCYKYLDVFFNYVCIPVFKVFLEARGKATRIKKVNMGEIARN